MFNVLFFIRLLLKHIAILIILPIFLAAMVFFLTKNEAKTYDANTSIYTGIATGSSIVSLEGSKFDLFATRAAFDNLINIIKSRSTMEEVSIRLLATHLMLEKPVSEIISVESYNNLMKIVPEEVKKLIVKNDYGQTISNLRKLKNSNHTNFVYELINYNHPHYSSKKIASKVRVSRVQSSDLIEVKYESSDPGICKNTLEILTEVFIKEYTNIKVNQSDAVVKYFQSQLTQADQKLNVAENELLQFNQKNTIINYYEQTKHVSSEKEHFDLTYLEIKMKNAAAKSVIAVLENKMTGRQRQRINNENIVNLRNELSNINLDIAMKTYEEQVDSSREETLINEISNLQTKAFDISQKLKESVNEQYFLDNSIEGVPSSSILEQWITKVIELETTKAEILIAEMQKLEFDKLFKNYAPLGATMKRLERKIDVAEREYLSLLHSLGLAKLKQQNIELNSNLKVVVEPLFAIEARASKRKFLIIIAFMLGFVLPAFVIIALEFLDRNIKTHERAEEFIGLKVAAIFPKLANNNKKLDIDFIKNRGLDVIARRLILNTEQNKEQIKPDTNIFFSNLDGEGKSTLLVLLLSKLAKIGYRILFLSHNELDEIEGVDFRKYNITQTFHRVKKAEDLDADFSGINLTDFDYVFIEIPGILSHTYPINLFQNSNHSFIVTRANRAWTQSDIFSLKDIIEYTADNQPQVLLNGVEIQEMENIIGDLPKKRTFIRRIIKNIFRLQFFTKNKLSKSDIIKKSKKTPSPKLFYLLIIPLISLFSFIFLTETSMTAKSTSNIKTDTILEKTKKVVEKPTSAISTKSEISELNNSSNKSTNSSVIYPAHFKNRYYLIGGSFRKSENAEQFFNQLTQNHYNPVYIERTNDLHTIAIGIYNNKKEAQESLQNYLKLNPRSDAWIFNGNLEEKNQQ